MELAAKNQGLESLLLHRSRSQPLTQNHTRHMPFLLPPPEFKPGELATMGLTGTCEMQLCRSAGPWSLGTPNRIERSIQTAYREGEPCLAYLEGSADPE
jgi:hypothetical protein